MKNNNKIISFFAVLMILIGSVVSTANAQTPQEKYATAKTAYQNEVNFYKTTRQQFLTAKSNYLKLKNATNKKAYEAQARAYLIKTTDVLIKKLESIKTWVSNRKTLSEPDKQNIISEIDGDISEVTNIRSGIDTAATEQIISKAKELRDYWKSHRVSVKKIVGQVWSARINYVITQAENAAVKVDAKIQELKAAGKDTAKLEIWLADFNQKIVAAKEKNELAKARFQAIDTLANADQLFKEGHQFILDANKYIRDAHAVLVEIVKEMKDMIMPTPVPVSTSNLDSTLAPIE